MSLSISNQRQISRGLNQLEFRENFAALWSELQSLATDKSTTSKRRRRQIHTEIEKLLREAESAAAENAAADSTTIPMLFPIIILDERAILLTAQKIWLMQNLHKSGDINTAFAEFKRMLEGEEEHEK